MPQPSKSIWYHLGYALESASHGAQAAQEARSAKNAPLEAKGTAARESRSSRKVHGRSTDPERKPVSSAVDQFIATGTGVLGDRLLSILLGRRPGPLRLTHAALAGAGAALVLSLFRHGVNGTGEEWQNRPEPIEALLRGAARGVLYGSVLEPRLPGPPLLRGATYGVIEYVTSPFGGLDGILGASSPHRTMPILAALVGTSDSTAGSMVDHVAFGITLGLLYGAGSERRGSREAE